MFHLMCYFFFFFFFFRVNMILKCHNKILTDTDTKIVIFVSLYSLWTFQLCGLYCIRRRRAFIPTFFFSIFFFILTLSFFFLSFLPLRKSIRIMSLFMFLRGQYYVAAARFDFINKHPLHQSHHITINNNNKKKICLYKFDNTNIFSLLFFLLIYIRKCLELLWCLYTRTEDFLII